MRAPNNDKLNAIWIRQCQSALRKHKGHRAKSAEELGISLRALYRHLAENPEILRGIDSLRSAPASTTLTAAQIKRIRDRLANGERGSVLAGEYDVSIAAISRIKNGSRRVVS